MDSARQLGYPLEQRKSLDFGCGVGRLTRALATHFDQCYGVDISKNVITRAKELNQSSSNSSFIVNTVSDLSIFKDSQFDLIYTNIVQQHVPGRSVIKAYIVEFVRTLSEQGLLVFQLPCRMPRRNMIQPRRRAYSLLRSLGFSEKFLYEQLKLNPIRMNFIPETEVVDVLNNAGARVLQIHSKADSRFKSNTYYVTK